jgi:hypothetical protein
MYLSPADLVGKAWQHILNDVTFNGLAIDRLSGTLVVLAAVGYAVTFLALTWWRYQNVEVDR